MISFNFEQFVIMHEGNSILVNKELENWYDEDGNPEYERILWGGFNTTKEAYKFFSGYVRFLKNVPSVLDRQYRFNRKEYPKCIKLTWGGVEYSDVSDDYGKIIEIRRYMYDVYTSSWESRIPEEY